MRQRPVSYTHLDVYKRQMQPYMSTGCQYLLIYLICFLPVSMPVSYTHLLLYSIIKISFVQFLFYICAAFRKYYSSRKLPDEHFRNYFLFLNFNPVSLICRHDLPLPACDRHRSHRSVPHLHTVLLQKFPRLFFRRFLFGTADYLSLIHI